MIEFSLEQVAAAVSGQLSGAGQIAVTSVVTDSREVQAGALFVAVVGENSDGHNYLETAAAAGAVGALVSALHPGLDLPQILVPDTVAALGELAREVLAAARAAGPIQVVAVTGSAGKTTTKDLLAQLLGEHGPTVAPQKSFNNEIGLPLTVLQITAETRYLVLEMGASAIGEIAYLCRIAPPDVAIALNVGSAHLGGFGGPEQIARAKSEIVQHLRAGGTAVLNYDDDRVAKFADLTGERIITFGQRPDADFSARDISVVGGRVSFTLLHGPEQARVSLRLFGEHQVFNALAAAAGAAQLGLTFAQVSAGLQVAEVRSSHRMAVVDRADGVTVIDDSYNANPESVRAALRALVSMSQRQRRTVAVLGEMRELGEQSIFEHDAIGRLLVRLNVSLAIAVGPEAKPIADAAQHEGSWGQEIMYVPDLDSARQAVQDNLRTGDIVLLKGSNSTELWRLADELTEPGAQSAIGGDH